MFKYNKKPMELKNYVIYDRFTNYFGANLAYIEKTKEIFIDYVNQLDETKFEQNYDKIVELYPCFMEDIGGYNFKPIFSKAEMEKIYDELNKIKDIQKNTEHPNPYVSLNTDYEYAKEVAIKKIKELKFLFLPKQEQIKNISLN